MTEPFTIEAIRLLGKYILPAFGNGDNIEARKAMVLGSHYAGIGIANAKSGAVGALSYLLKESTTLSMGSAIHS